MRLADLPPLLNVEQAELTTQTLKELDSIRTLHVSNRADAIFTAYYDTPTEATIALDVLGHSFESLGLPVDVISNGSTRVRVIAKGLSKKRARDYMSARFPQIVSGRKMILGDNFDPENPLSDIGMITGKAGDVQALPGVVAHRELMGELKAKKALDEILQKRGHFVGDGLVPFEANSLLDQFAGNIYDSVSGNILTKSVARIQMNPNSLVYFLDDSAAVLVSDHRAGIDAIVSPNLEERPVVLNAKEKVLLDWVRRETRGESSRVAVLTSDVIHRAGFETFAEAQAVMSKKLKMKALDATPYGYIGFLELPGRFVYSDDSSDKPTIEAADTTGGIDLRAKRMDLQTTGSGEGIRFNMDPAQLQEMQNAPGFVPVIFSIQPLEDLPIFLGVKARESVPSAG